MIIQIILLIILIFLNAVFAASEIAFLSMNKIKLSQEIKKGNKRAEKIRKLLNNTSSFLATIQIGITLAGFLASAFAAEAFADDIVIWLAFLNIANNILKPIVVIIVTLILSYFTLVFGELVPKKVALRYPEKIAYFMVGFITILAKITYPFVFLLTASTNFFSKLFGVKENDSEEKITEEQIKLMIAEGKDIGAIESGEKELIYNIFKFNDTNAVEIMTKTDDVYAIELDMPAKEIMKLVKQSKYTRYPVYVENINNIIGIFNVKDIILEYSKTKVFDLKKLIHEPFYINAEEKIDDIFKMMQKRREAIAIVVKNEEEVVGIVTMEDILEEIVGNIFDEYDDDENE